MEFRIRFFKVILCAFLLSGCVKSMALKNYSDVSYYSTDGVVAGRSLTAINEFVTEKIEIIVYSDGIFAFRVNRIHEPGSMEIRLTQEQQQGLKDALKKALTWGETAKKEQLNVSKKLYGFKDNPLAAYESLTVSFISGSNGKTWGSHLTFGLTEQFVLLEDQTLSLISYLENVEEYSKKATKTQEKMELLK
ncbi:hypothetical protein [Desulfosarcina ovata]|uniref:Lipoprotein n=1 Tax=Desulfosarcina ovata subsp. ovata TaxID=2752305 RepID=A0A5K8AHK1_9BACT|nr:hypothetical protein [Desulfosarcina ovata]BBO91959.1 hypothetical protein DSCOOX_51390 [Desulfosarcina ovata subsp. ovata]